MYDDENEMASASPKPRVSLTREQVLAADDLRTEWVDVPEWGGALKVRGLSVAEVNHIVNLSTRKGKLETMQSALFTFVRGVVEPHFDDADIDDLKKKSAVVLRVVKEINRVSGITDTALDDAEKN